MPCTRGKSNPDDREAVANDQYGKHYEELSGKEQMVVGGSFGGKTRKEQLGHEGYVEMGHKGGEARKEQLGHNEEEGIVHFGYDE